MKLQESAELTPSDVTRYWVDEIGPDGWYKADDAVDAEIRTRFLPGWELAAAGGLSNWTCSPARLLSYLILTDQFPRNMFRGDPRSFETDRFARAAALRGIFRGWDVRVPEPERQFYYLPLMHSEVLEDQERALRLILTRMPESGASNLLHARAHREVIRRYGRFPHRNADLGRTSTRQETVYLDTGGYGGVVRELQSTEAA